jgi:hypothetical protein
MPTAISSADHLGQRMVRSFCRQLGAIIDFKTLPQRGTVVSIRVSLRPDGAPQDAPAEPPTD